MLKLALMLIWTLTGIIGGLAYSPFLPVLVYHFFSVLRPQFMWIYSLDPYVQRDFPWSFLVAIAAIGTSFIWRSAHWIAPNRFKGVDLPRFHVGHACFGAFALWITITYVNARNQAVAEPYFDDYRKIFLMFFITSLVMISVRQAWVLYLSSAVALGYIGYEVNEIYLTSGGYNFIYRQGFCGLDNNGAALLLSMGIPLCIFAWDGIKHWIRWIFPVMALLIIHSILLSYSRGAMLSALLVTPLYFVRARHRKMILIFAGIGLALLPVMAGREIVERFASIGKHEEDGSAASRKTTWAIAFRMAVENPVFGLGIRNSPLYTYDYGADEQGRVIHSTYLQIAADSGFVGLAAYVSIILGGLYSCRCVRHAVAGSITTGTVLAAAGRFAAGENWRVSKTEGLSGHDAELAYSMACGVEGSLISFAFGCMFLSLETFEPFYLVAGLGIQLWSIIQVMQRQQVATV
ncbi:O-antigen ligase family protein [Zavarzinella formosa]|uniref:O-antigen ligase family protein n=1 Tax=Zavarzinella formosa TaxID=360055 RepID=UPI000300B76C|nr:O-antigen ligase family protein [Zavarzinella formosa]